MENIGNSEMQKSVTGMLGQLTTGFKSCLDDLWSLEINTMVVSDIGGLRFNPIHCYENFFLLPDDLDAFKEQLNLKAYESLPIFEGLSDDSNLRRDFLGSSPLPNHLKKVFLDKMFPKKTREQSDGQYNKRQTIENIESTIRKYIQLKNRLRLAFQSCVIRREVNAPSDATPSSDTRKQQAVSPASKMVASRKSIGIESDKAVTLPLPSLDVAMSIGLLENSAFLREMRSLRELFYLVGGEDASDTTNFIDLIAAQTIIQMDGDVMNRFHKTLLHESERNFLVQTHQQALSTGQENWKSLVRLIIESMQTLSGFLGITGSSSR